MEATLMQHVISTGPAEWLIASVWQGLVLTALAALLLRLASGLRASTRFTLWLIVFLLVALLPFLAEARGSAATIASDHSLQLSSIWAYMLEGVWLAASLYSLLRLAINLRAVRKLQSNSTLITQLPPEIEEAVSRPGKLPVELRLSDAIDSPSVVGFFRPTVIVPRTIWQELSPADMKQVLLHEVAHLERGDDWTNLIQKLVRALSPLNPALFWAERQLCREREHACDDAVLDQAGNARAYATCLTKLAESRLVRRMSALAPGMWQRRSELAGRVENILHRRRTMAPWLSRGFVTAGILAALSGAAMLQRIPGMVTFSSAARMTASVAPVELPEAPKPSLVHYNEAQAHPQIHEAVYRPDMSATGERASLQPRHIAKRPADNFRHLQILQVAQDPETGGVTLVLLTVDVPSSARSLHNASRSFISTTDHWISFQI